MIMKKVLIFLIISTLSVFAEDLGKKFKMQNPVEGQLLNKEIQLAPGVKMNAGNFILMTNMKKNPAINIYFDKTFEKQFLLKPAQYNEDIKAENDKLVITRTLVIEPKDPCMPGIKDRGAVSMCFKKTTKTYSAKQKQDFTNELDKIRAKASSLQPDSDETKMVLAMTDDELMDYLLNKRSKRKIIIHESVIPLAVYNADTKLERLDIMSQNFVVPQTGQYTNTISKDDLKVSTVPTGMLGVNSVKLNKQQLNKQVVVKKEITFDDFRMNNDMNAEDITFESKKDESYKFIMGETFGKYDGDSFKYIFAEEGWFTDEYYVRFSYDFGMTMGLRFPFQADVNSEIELVETASGGVGSYPQKSLCKGAATNEEAYKCALRANMFVKAKGLDAGADFYRSAGIESSKINDGKEFVFKVQAGMKIKLSIPGPNISYSPSLADVNYSRDFKSPVGSQNSKIVDFVLGPDVTGLGIFGDIGVASVSAGLDVGAYATAKNGEFSFNAKNYNSIMSCHPDMSFTDEAKEYKCQIRDAVPAGQTKNWGVSLSDASYSSDFVLTPQVGLSVSADVLGWDWSYSFGPYPLTALSVDLGNYEFSRHSGTPASYEFYVSERAK